MTTEKPVESIYFVTNSSNEVIGFARAINEDQALERACIATGLYGRDLFVYPIQIHDNPFVNKMFIINKFDDERILEEGESIEDFEDEYDDDENHDDNDEDKYHESYSGILRVMDGMLK